MKQKTPMQELLEILEEDQYCGSKSKFAKSFLEKEKQQITEAYREGVYNNTFGNNNFDDEQDYYNSNFGDKVEEAGI